MLPFPESFVFGNFRDPSGPRQPGRAGYREPVDWKVTHVIRMRELNKVGEFLFKDFRNVGFCRIRADWHSHGDSAAAQRTVRYTDISAAPLAVGHFAYIKTGDYKSR